jgi:prepilin-type N-terminal cleavage/methylation domain-containing protein
VKPNRPSSRAGFTLLEIMLALAIISLIAAALIGGASQLLSTKPKTADAVFWSVVRQARKAALEGGGNDVQVSYDKKTGAFKVDDGTNPKTVSVPNATPDLAIDFISAQTGQATALLGGMAVVTETLPFVTFYNDGTCSPFRVQIHNQIAVHILNIDPWTCAQMLNVPNANGVNGT